MKYLEIGVSTVANQHERVVLYSIHSTRYHKGLVGFSVRKQRRYDELWLPVGKRQFYGRNAWDYSSQEHAQKKIEKLLGGKKNE
ncbi:hypothetical protein HYX13_04365 [Candidatus Woesearchaeota archaeon]|nr:hypothetical protein [Candidatus Woesearchaeota archaeon]